MSLRSIRRPLALCLFPWLLALLAGLLAVGPQEPAGVCAELLEEGSEPPPPGGGDLDPNG